MFHLFSEKADHGQPFDFTCNLPHVISLDQDQWEIGMTDIRIFGTKRILEDDLMVCTDIIEPRSLVGERFEPTLAVISRIGEVQNPVYFTVAPEYLQRIRVYIRDTKMNDPAIQSKAVRVSLHLKRK